MLPGCPYSCTLHWPPVPRERFSPWAESAPTRVALGRTGVRAKAAIPFAERGIDFASLSPSNVMVNDSGGGRGGRRLWAS